MKQEWKNIGLQLWSLAAVASTGAPAAEEQKPLEINGQSRSLNMMLVLRNDKDKIKFVKLRENYRNEILDEASTGLRAPGQNTPTITQEE